VAVKVLRDDLAADHRHIQRLIAEAEITSCLRHPNIVQFLDGGALPCRTPYVVLEYLEGESLRQRLDRGAIPVAETIEIARQVGAALAAAHRAGVVHRDLKPDNVFLCTAADGMATSGASVGLNAAETERIGTPRYMAPEQAAGDNDLVDRRSDVFALGAVVYEMLSGRPAFDGEGPAQLAFQVTFEESPALAGLVPGLPPHVADAVHRALEKRPDARFPDAASFVEALSGSPLSPAESRRAVGASAVALVDAPTSDVPWWPAPKKTLAAIAAALLAIGAGAGAMLAARASDAPSLAVAEELDRSALRPAHD
jgi:serine/threonine-protein kinase